MSDPPSPAELATAAARLAAVEARIMAACARAGRPRAAVTLLGVSKTQPPDRVLALYKAGLATFGENRVQEAVAKAAELPAAIDWHLIGPLQTNKVRSALRLFSTIHAVDRLRLAQALAEEAERLGREVACFLEINLAGEASKHGFAPAELLAELVELAALPRLRWLGLMAIPPFADDPEASRPWFRQLRLLRDRLASAGPLAGFAGQLSMGMSADFEIAIEEGSTHVRVGTALFGARG